LALDYERTKLSRTLPLGETPLPAAATIAANLR
jgi:hypothetical protein